MRGFLLSLGFAMLVSSAAPAQAARSTIAPSLVQASPVYALQVPDKKIEITVGDRGVSARWYRNPVWIAIGVLAVIVLLLLVILAVRGGGGTTIIRE